MEKNCKYRVTAGRANTTPVTVCGPGY